MYVEKCAEDNQKELYEDRAEKYDEFSSDDSWILNYWLVFEILIHITEIKYKIIKKHEYGISQNGKYAFRRKMQRIQSPTISLLCLQKPHFQKL